MPKEKLIIFVKNEEAGKVKTRLADSVGDDKALEIYQKLLAYTFEQTRQLDLDKEVWYSRFIPKNDIWETGEFKKVQQSGLDLGKRMSNAFRKTFEDEGYDKAVIIGSDCPELTSEIIQQAFKKLDEVDFVIGPAEDGGYYLLGMRDYHPEVFREIEWSMASVFEQTMKKIQEAGVTFAKLEQLNDIDTLEDWERAKIKI